MFLGCLTFNASAPVASLRPDPIHFLFKVKDSSSGVLVTTSPSCITGVAVDEC